MLRLSLIAAAVLSATAAMAQESKEIQKIEVKGAAQAYNPRRDDTASKIIVSSEEIKRYGDTSIGDALKRVPGVSVGAGGRDIRLRGLGNGYTQILLNGEKAPAGFNIESIAPDNIERIEVIRAASAEFSTRAIAGTINIVLRDGYQMHDIQVKGGDTIEQGRHSPNVSVTLPGKSGALTYTLSAAVQVNHRHDHTSTHNTDTEAGGDVVKDQQLQSDSSGSTGHVHVTPRFSYKFANGDQLNFQPFLMHMKSHSGSDSTLDQAIGSMPPEYNLAQQQSQNDMTFLRGFGNWVHRLQGASKLDVRFGFGLGKSSADSVRYQFDNAGTLLNRFTDTDSTRDRSLNNGGKYSTPLGKGHLLAAGWDLEASHREQVRVSLDKNGTSQFADSGDNLTADTRRLAVFAQDEWDITPQWSVYMGARWEGIRTTSDRSAGTVSNTSKVFSPLLHGVWKIPGHEKDQLRASLTRSYKAPDLYSLLARPTLNSIYPLPTQANDPVAADRAGNPALRPELATGIDLAYERYFNGGGMASIGVFQRHVSDLIRNVTTLEQVSWASVPRWVSRPQNLSSARSSGLELEVRGPAASLLPGLVSSSTRLDLRAAVNFYHSKVAAVPLPNSRLDGQQPWSATLGFDYKASSLPLALGANLAYTPGYLTQQTLAQSLDLSRNRALDLYAQWTFNPSVSLRLAATNAAPQWGARRTVSSDGTEVDVQRKSRASYSVALDIKL